MREKMLFIQVMSSKYSTNTFYIYASIPSLLGLQLTGLGNRHALPLFINKTRTSYCSRHKPLNA